MKRLIFSIYIDIPEEKLDNPASWDNETGTLKETDKSKVTKEKLALWKDRLVAKQKQYAFLCGADYKLYDDQQEYEEFALWFEENAPQISYYDVINFYKHHLMYMNSFMYDEICYFDLDVVPLTTLSLFEEFDMSKMHVGESNAESMWGRNVDLKWYNACIRNPSSKFFNSQAMAYEMGYKSPDDVFNTGIMFANWHVIQRLKYFDRFQENLEMMTMLKEDEDSMYPWEIRRSFGYDNETLFGYRVIDSGIEYETLPLKWNTTSLKDLHTNGVHLVHVISKDFNLVL